MDRRSLLKMFAAAPAAYVLGSGLVTPETAPEDLPEQVKVGEMAARFRVEGGDWQNVSIPIYGTKDTDTLIIDYVAITIDRALADTDEFIPPSFVLGLSDVPQRL